MSTPEYVSIAQAAERLNLKPWDMVRLIESGEVSSVQLVEVASLTRLPG